mmetsp:Transcript_14258/g.53992  ORF Transcript_14258/g.53992 Transcript_14258/m.53992 type:complete len:246 (-) Transcript_14258:1360-2097(-)
MNTVRCKRDAGGLRRQACCHPACSAQHVRGAGPVSLCRPKLIHPLFEPFQVAAANRRRTLPQRVLEVLLRHRRLGLLLHGLDAERELRQRQALLAQASENPPHGHHCRVARQVGQVRTAEALRTRSQACQVNVVCKHDGAQVEPEQRLPVSLSRERDVDAFFEATAEGFVELPRQVGCGKHDHLRPGSSLLTVAARVPRRGLSRGRGRHAVHLNQQLRFDASRSLVLGAAATGRRERVNLVDEDC